MKKFIYTLVFACAIAMSFTACTEEEVTPTVDTENGGGQGLDPKGPGL